MKRKVYGKCEDCRHYGKRTCAATKQGEKTPGPQDWCSAWRERK
jgi:hypothetical protein